MSSAGNQYINLAPTAAPLPYELQLAQLQRQQRLADQMRQESTQPIQTPMSGQYAGPISWGSVLGKVLQGVSASMKENRAQGQLKQIGQQDTDSAQALVRQLTQPTYQAGAPSIAPVNTQIDPTAPQLPGQGAPAQQAPVPMQLGGEAGSASATATPPAMPDQLAALLAARGGPQTQMIQQAMLPQILNRQNLDYQNTLNRSNKLWENTLGMSTADRERAAAQLQNQEAQAQFVNRLPQTAAQQAAHDVAEGQLGVSQGQLAETKRYHSLMTGQGMDENGMPNPVVGAWRDQIARGNANIQNVPKEMRSGVAVALNNAPKEIFSPLAGSRFTMESSRITKPYTNLPQYSLTANGLPYLQRIDAALKVPGSVSDQDLLDSLTKLNTAGNAVTDAQVRIITDGKSFKDWVNIIANKFKTGGVLSQDQRQQIKEIANNIYANYKHGYQPVYDHATEQLKAAGVPKAFWTIPDLNDLNSGQSVVGTPAPVAAPGAPSPPPPAATAAPQGIPQGWTLHQDAQGRKAYVSPDGKQFKEVP